MKCVFRDMFKNCPLSDRHYHAVVGKHSSITPITLWGYKCLKEANSFSKSFIKQFRLQSKFFCQHRHTDGCSILMSSLIIGLLFGGCPSAIPRCVWPVVINAIKRMFIGRSWPHVSVKVLEDLPSQTDNYSSTCVINVPFTAGFHAYPNSVFRNLVGFPVGLAIRKSSFDAAARLLSTRGEVGHFHGLYCSALAHAFEVTVFGFWQFLNHSQSSKHGSLCDRFHGFHNWTNDTRMYG